MKRAPVDYLLARAVIKGEEVPERDFLDELIEERTACSPGFQAMAQSYYDRCLARRFEDEPEFSGFAPLREDDDVVPVTRVRPVG